MDGLISKPEKTLVKKISLRQPKKEPVDTDCINKAINSYPPSRTIVVQVHKCSCVPLLFLLGIDKRLGELDGVIHMVTTAAPVKGSFGIMWWTLFSRVTGAGVQLSLTASSGQCVDHACWGDGVHKGSLTTAWEYAKLKCKMQQCKKACTRTQHIKCRKLQHIQSADPVWCLTITDTPPARQQRSLRENTLVHPCCWFVSKHLIIFFLL